MTNRLVIHFPKFTNTYDSDDVSKIITLSDFCKKELGAYNATDNIDELTVDELSDEMSNKLHSLLFELGLL